MQEALPTIFPSESGFAEISNCSNQSTITRWFDATLEVINSNLTDPASAWTELVIMRRRDARKQQKMYLWTNQLLYDPTLLTFCSDHLCASNTVLVAPTKHNDIFFRAACFLIALSMMHRIVFHFLLHDLHLNYKFPFVLQQRSGWSSPP